MTTAWLPAPFDDAPIEHPLCPAHCCFRRFCVPRLQEAAVRDIWANNHGRESCPQYVIFERIVRREFAVEPPETVDELIELLGERGAIREESWAYERERRAAAEAPDRAEADRIEQAFASMPERIHGHGIKTDVGTSRPAGDVRPLQDNGDPFPEQLRQHVESLRKQRVERDRARREETTGQQELVL